MNVCDESIYRMAGGYVWDSYLSFEIMKLDKAGNLWTRRIGRQIISRFIRCFISFHAMTTFWYLANFRASIHIRFPEQLWGLVLFLKWYHRREAQDSRRLSAEMIMGAAHYIRQGEHYVILINLLWWFNYSQTCLETKCYYLNIWLTFKKMVSSTLNISSFNY